MDKLMSNLKRTVIASGVDQLLTQSGPFTLFAPVDAAFHKLDAETVDGYLNPAQKEKTTSLVNHHVVKGTLHIKDMKDGDKLENLDGKELLVGVKDGVVNINGATIINGDMRASNGVVHSIDEVLVN